MRAPLVSAAASDKLLTWVAIEEFGIVNPEHQQRLFVRRVPGDDG